MDRTNLSTAAAPDNAQSAPALPARALAHHHAKELALALKALNPGCEFQIVFSDDERSVFVIPAETPPAPVFDGPANYEVETKRGTRPILWIERHQYRTKPGFYFTGQHRWRGKPEGKPRRLREDQIRIIRKIDSEGRA